MDVAKLTEHLQSRRLKVDPQKVKQALADKKLDAKDRIDLGLTSQNGLYEAYAAGGKLQSELQAGATVDTELSSDEFDQLTADVEKFSRVFGYTTEQAWQMYLTMKLGRRDLDTAEATSSEYQKQYHAYTPKKKEDTKDYPGFLKETKKVKGNNPILVKVAGITKGNAGTQIVLRHLYESGQEDYSVAAVDRKLTELNPQEAPAKPSVPAPKPAAPARPASPPPAAPPTVVARPAAPVAPPAPPAPPPVVAAPKPTAKPEPKTTKPQPLDLRWVDGAGRVLASAGREFGAGIAERAERAERAQDLAVMAATVDPEPARPAVPSVPAAPPKAVAPPPAPPPAPPAPPPAANPLSPEPEERREAPAPPPKPSPQPKPEAVPSLEDFVTPAPRPAAAAGQIVPVIPTEIGDVALSNHVPSSTSLPRERAKGEVMATLRQFLLRGLTNYFEIIKETSIFAKFRAKLIILADGSVKVKSLEVSSDNYYCVREQNGTDVNVAKEEIKQELRNLIEANLRFAAIRGSSEEIDLSWSDIRVGYKPTLSGITISRKP